MEIKIREAIIDSNYVSAIAEFSSTLVEIASITHQNGYSGRGDIINMICKEIAERIADEYLAENKSDIMGKIDIDKIINGVQLKVVESFSLQR